MGWFTRGPKSAQELEELVEQAKQIENPYEASEHWNEILEHATQLRLQLDQYITKARNDTVPKFLDQVLVQRPTRGTLKATLETLFQQGTSEAQPIVSRTSAFLDLQRFIQGCYNLGGAQRLTAMNPFAQRLYGEFTETGPTIEALSHFDQALNQVTQTVSEWNHEFGLPPATPDKVLSRLKSGQEPVAFKALDLGVGILRKLAGQTPQDIQQLKTQLNQHYWIKHLVMGYHRTLGVPIQIPIEGSQPIELSQFVQALEETITQKITPYVNLQNQAFNEFVRPIEEKQDQLYDEAVRQFRAFMKDKKPTDFEPLLQDPRVAIFSEKSRRSHAAVLYASTHCPEFEQAMVLYGNFSTHYAGILQEDTSSLFASYAEIPSRAAELIDVEESSALNPEVDSREPEQTA